MGDGNKNLNNKTGSIILAGGLGERLKAVGSKPFLLYKDKSFLQIAVDNVKLIRLNSLVIVTNDLFFNDIKQLNFPAKILINPHPEQGMLSSILIGLKEIKSSCCSGFFLCAVDYPLVQQKTYHKLLLAHQSLPDQIIKPIFKGKKGHPIVFPRNLFHALQKAPLDQGARFVTRQYSHLTTTVEVSDPGILININTPEIYHQYCK
ncbi:MAG: nucleotidyltransferase family protein [bacterium]|nr:MAG: nucleotidyltransferase family protein [bacterium]